MTDQAGVENNNRACVDRSSRGRGYALPCRPERTLGGRTLGTIGNVGPDQLALRAGELMWSERFSRSSVVTRADPFS